MKKEMPNRVAKARVITGPMGTDAKFGFNGLFLFRRRGQQLRVICSDGAGWDHVSVSLFNRCPTWDEMCYIKNLFFDDDETVIQFHPSKKDYVNYHPHTLHLWKRQGQEYELPPWWMIGPEPPAR